MGPAASPAGAGTVPTAVIAGDRGPDGRGEYWSGSLRYHSVPCRATPAPDPAGGWPRSRDRRRLPDRHESAEGKRMATVAAEFWTARRTVIGSALAALGGAAPAAGPDADLLQLSARLVAIERAVDAFPGDIGPDSPAAVLALLDEHDAALRAMLRTPARGLEGYQAKAAAVDAMLPRPRPGDWPGDPEALVRSLVADLLGTRPEGAQLAAGRVC